MIPRLYQCEKCQADLHFDLAATVDYVVKKYQESSIVTLEAQPYKQHDDLFFRCSNPQCTGTFIKPAAVVIEDMKQNISEAAWQIYLTTSAGKKEVNVNDAIIKYIADHLDEMKHLYHKNDLLRLFVANAIKSATR